MMETSRLRITADKRLRFTSPKLPSATSFIHKRYVQFPRTPLETKCY